MDSLKLPSTGTQTNIIGLRYVTVPRATSSRKGGNNPTWLHGGKSISVQYTIMLQWSNGIVFIRRLLILLDQIPTTIYEFPA